MSFDKPARGIEKDSRPLLRCILFDAVGTLIYAAPSVAEVYQAIGRRHGVVLGEFELKDRFAAALASAYRDETATDAQRERERWRAIVCHVFHEHSAAGESLFDELWRHFARPDSWQLYEDAPAALAKLAAAGFQLGIASNFDSRLADVCRGHAPLHELPVFCSCEVGYAKPDRRFFDAVAKRLALPPAEILLVGDHAIDDLQGATAAGWQAVLITRREETFSATTPSSFAISSLQELPALLASARQQ